MRKAMIDTLSRVFIFFSFIGLGALLVRLKRLNAEGLEGLSAYFYWLGFPAYLLGTFSQLPQPDAQMLIMVGVYCTAMIMAAIITYLILRLRHEPVTHGAGAAMASLINNSAFLGIPITISLFGKEAGLIGPFTVAADFLILFGVGCAALAYASGQGIRAALMRTLKNPTVLASAAGLLLMAFGVRFPLILQNGIDLMGHTASPVALVALGGMLGLLPARTLIAFNFASAIAVTGKILIAPALVAIALHLIGVPPLMFKVAVFLAACPTAISVFIQTRIYNTWFEGAAVSIAQSTVLSLLTLSALALILTAAPA
jgi:malonate transporter and related proteins